MSELSSKVLQIQKIFEENGCSLCFAESCTGGLLSATLAAQAGVSKFFKGAVVSYAGSVKNEILGVPLAVLQKHGEVSEATALEMASGARGKLKTDWAVAVTGIAGPSGGSAAKPVGMVCFAVAGPGVTKSYTSQFGEKKTRNQIQTESVRRALDLLIENVN